MKKLILISCMLAIALTTIAQQSDFTKLSGLYLGQKPPGIVPERFAPGIVSINKMAHSPMAISNDGDEIAWYSLGDERSVNPKCRIFFSRQKDGYWQETDSLAFRDDETISDLFFSDDNILNCISFHFESSGSKYTYYHYTFQRTEKGWINPGRSQNKLGENYEIECTNKNIIITSSDKPGGFGVLDLYVSFEDKNGSLSREISLGEKINTRLNEHYPSFSPDGEYFFFVRGGKYYWVSSEIIEKLKSEVSKLGID